MRTRFVIAALTAMAICVAVSLLAFHAGGDMRSSGMGGHMAFHAPTNLRSEGTWEDGPTDVLTWSPVPGAVAYNVYLYDVKIGENIRDTTWIVPRKKFCRGLTYTVTAVNDRGMESIPSNLAFTHGGRNPDAPPQARLVSRQRPSKPPSDVVAVGEWNANAPRIRVSWRGRISMVYDIYRDGTKIASDITNWDYFDNDVRPGERHTYTVAGIQKRIGEEEPGGSAQATAPAGPPAFVGKVMIAGILPNDDSAMITFRPVPGAVDYRCYKASDPSVKKYSGGGLSIEYNGFDPRTGVDLVVEAVDKPGPFQKMDGEMGPGAMNMGVAINGQGDPSNIPNVIARSDVFHVNARPRTLAGDQVFFDKFRDSKPFQPVADPTQAIFEKYGRRADRFREFENDRWLIRYHDADMKNTKIFVMSDHFMDTTYDGGTPRGKLPLHTTNASLVMMPKAMADISHGRVLHVTMEVDAHFDSRRWCDIVVARAGDPLLRPGLPPRDNRPTVSGDMFRWEIKNGVHHVQLFSGGVSRSLLNTPELRRFAGRLGRKGEPGFNGTVTNLDKRHQFDLYLSQYHFRLMEEGQVVADADFPPNQPLPFDRAQVYFVHQVYHTANDHPELIAFLPHERYWIEYRPWADERHWDNMGFAVLPSMPEAVLPLRPISASRPARPGRLSRQRTGGIRTGVTALQRQR